MAGYTRNDTGNNIADGNVINAADLDGEFDSIQTAFNETSGHTHDGTVGEGAPISVVGPAQDINVTITEVVPKTTNTMSLGTAALQFKDLYIDGTANIDSLVADTADINAGTIDNAVIGGATPEAATFTTLTATDAVSLDDAVTINESAADVDFRVEGVGKPNALFVQGSDGNVGVNTNSPTTTLDVNGTVKASVLNVAGSSSLDGAVVVNETGADVDFRVESDTNSHALFVQGSNGAVGIGTSSPLSQLEVSDTDGATGINVTAYRNLTAYGNSYVQFNGPRFDTADQDAVIGRGAITLLGNAADTSSSMWISAATASLAPATATEANMQGYNAGLNITSDGELGFWDSGTERFTITSAGRVGIGTSSPATTLDVNGGITGTSLDMNGNADFAGQVYLSRADSTTVTRTDDIGTLSMRGGSTNVTGANVVLYGSSHPTLPGASIFNSDTMLFRPVDNSPEFMRFSDGIGTIFNETSADLDFRIESDTNTHAFFLQGSDGNVGIGTSSPSEKLHLSQDSAFAIQMERTGGTPSVCEIANSGNLLNISNNSNGIVFLTGATPEEAVRIKADGNVGIGTSSPSQLLEIRGAAARIRITDADTAGTTGIEFVDSGGVVDAEIEVGNSTQYFAVKTAAQERMRIDASGNVGIGTSSPQTNLHVDAGTKNYTGTTPGLGSYAMSIESGSTGTCGIGIGSHNNIPSIQGFGGGTGYNLALCPSNGSVAIGHTSPSQALDVVGNIEVSGGIYLGGTAAANLLDDYEEGTWEPAYQPQTGALGSITYSIQAGNYTKVGRQVTVTGRITTTGSVTIGTASSGMRISGLPFTAGNGEAFYSAAPLSYIESWTIGDAPSSAYVATNSNLMVLRIRNAGSDGPENNMTPSEFVSGADGGCSLMFSATYFTA
jgi:hypothetical protein